MKRKIIAILLREIDRQRNNEPVFPLPYIGEIDENGLIQLDGYFNVRQLADALIKELGL